MLRKNWMKLMAAACVLALLAGCGQKPAASAPQDAPAASAPQEEPAASVLPDASAPEVPDQPEASVDPAYQAIIDLYAAAMVNGDGAEDLMLQGVNYMAPDVPKESEGARVGWLVADVNEDGRDELVIAADSESPFFHGMILDFYTLEDGEAVQRFVSSERNRWYWCGTNRVLNIGSSSAAQSGWYLSTCDYDMAFVDCVEMDAVNSPDDPWMAFTGETWKHIPEEEALERVDRLEASIRTVENLNLF